MDFQKKEEKIIWANKNSFLEILSVQKSSKKERLADVKSILEILTVQTFPKSPKRKRFWQIKN